MKRIFRPMTVVVARPPPGRSVPALGSEDVVAILEGRRVGRLPALAVLGLELHPYGQRHVERRPHLEVGSLALHVRLRAAGGPGHELQPREAVGREEPGVAIREPLAPRGRPRAPPARLTGRTEG